LKPKAPAKTSEQKLQELSDKLKGKRGTRKKSGESCPVCGLLYEEFHTGESYQTIYDLMWVNDPDYRKWRYKGLSGILGKWKEIKESLWRGHLRECEQYNDWLLSGGEGEPITTEEDDERKAIQQLDYDDIIPDNDEVETPF